MASLKDCLKKAGKTIAASDKQVIQFAFREQRRQGVPENEAALNAVDAAIELANTERDEILAEVERQVGALPRPTPAPEPKPKAPAPTPTPVPIPVSELAKPRKPAKSEEKSAQQLRDEAKTEREIRAALEKGEREAALSKPPPPAKSEEERTFRAGIVSIDPDYKPKRPNPSAIGISKTTMSWFPARQAKEKNRIWYTNGHIAQRDPLIYKNWSQHKAEGRRGLRDWEHLTKGETADLINIDKVTPEVNFSSDELTPIAQTPAFAPRAGQKESGFELVVLARSDGALTGVQKTYFDHLLLQYKGGNLRFYQPFDQPAGKVATSAITVYLDGELVALVMPVRLGETQAAQRVIGDSPDGAGVNLLYLQSVAKSAKKEKGGGGGGSPGMRIVEARSVGMTAGANYQPLIEQQPFPPPAKPKTARSRGTPLRREDVLKPFLKAIGQPVFEGRVKGGARLGFFIPRFEVVRVKRMADLEVVAHELAHLIDKHAFGGFTGTPGGRGTRPWLVGPGSRALASELAGVSYDRKKVYEGFAEFVRLWMTQPEAAKTAAPQFNAWFETWTKLPPSENRFGKPLRDARVKMLEWFAQEPVQRLASKIGAGQNIDAVLASPIALFRQSVIDDLQGILEMEKSLVGSVTQLGPYENARLLKAAYSIVDGAIRFGAPVATFDAQGRIIEIKFVGKGLEQILSPLSDVDDFLQYATSVSANELMGQGRENLFTKEELAQGLKLNEGRPFAAANITDYDFALGEYQVWNKRIVDFAVSMGLVSKGARATWARRWYIPFYRVSQGTKVARGGGIEGNASAWKRLTGGTGNLRDILQNMVRNAEQMIVMGLQNQARREVVDFALANAGGKWIAPVPRETKPLKVQKDQVLAKLAQALGFPPSIFDAGPTNIPQGIDPDVFIAIVQQLKDWANSQGDLIRFWAFGQNPTVKGGDQVFAVLRSGKASFYEVSDPILWRAIQAMGSKQRPWMRRALSATRRFGQGTVTLTVDFMTANIWRDTWHGWAFSRHGFKPVLDSMRGMRARITSSQDYQDWIANAGGMSSYFIDDDVLKAHLRRFYTKKGINMRSVIDTPGKLLYALEVLADAFEASTRIGEFKQARADGVTPRSAALASREVSTDFAMRGDSEFAGWMYDSVIFLKAAVNGIDRAYRGFRDASKALVGKEEFVASHLFLKTGVFILVSVMLRAWNDDNPLYRELKDWDKDAHWHVFLRRDFSGDPETDYLHLRFPKIWEIGAMASSAERAMEMFLDNLKRGRADTEQFGRRLWWIMKEQLKLGFIPYVAQAPIETFWLNEDLFTETPVENFAMQQRLPVDRYSVYTSPSARRMGEVLDPMNAVLPKGMQLSPARIESLIRGYFNTWGMYALMGIDEAAFGAKLPTRPVSTWPGLRRFTGRKPAKVQAEEDFWQYLEEASQLWNSANFRIEQNRPEWAKELLTNPKTFEATQLQGIADAIRELSNASELIYRDNTLSRAEKREKLDAIQREKNKLFIGAVESIEEGRRQLEEAEERLKAGGFK